MHATIRTPLLLYHHLKSSFTNARLRVCWRTVFRPAIKGGEQGPKAAVRCTAVCMRCLVLAEWGVGPASTTGWITAGLPGRNWRGGRSSRKCHFPLLPPSSLSGLHTFMTSLPAFPSLYIPPSIRTGHCGVVRPRHLTNNAATMALLPHRCMHAYWTVVSFKDRPGRLPDR
ncbi:hypothetical protein P280DRAFT_299052 [Massarina eburnea CBS 473.64]|uniref:Uncharacterized protein n=1 Tax=Massarina eburnea CBS 473.64 TaxID=1395130 RepID=A0A6A6RGF1_9PLEO|nr:hypothetical protein P280DRAFT_299052 [Massarina eburnea CBS 473.64]